jgi:threonine/homoserine efflux transporter RhtA
VALLVAALLACRSGRRGRRAFTDGSALAAGVAVALLSSVIPYGWR